MNVKQSTIEALYEIIGECFKLNRWLDRWVSVLGVKFAMNNTAKLLHQGVAHFYPSFSDKIGESCLERYNIMVEYASTPEGKEDYDDPTQMFQMLEDKIVTFQNMFMAAEKVAWANDDLQVFGELNNLMLELNPITEQVVLLNDKAGIYHGNFASLDADIEENFWMLGEN